MGKDKSRTGGDYGNRLVYRFREILFDYYFGHHDRARSALSRWAAEVVARYRGVPGGAAVLSDEALARWPTDAALTTSEAFRRSSLRRASRSRSERLPIAQFLCDVLVGEWGEGDIKVLLTLRNQPDWLGSQYAQSSNLIRNASTADFERQVRRLLDAGDAYIDWSQWVAQLRDAVGEDAVTVLLQEDMDQLDYWQRLLRAVKMDESKAARFRPEALHRGNVRGDAAVGCWRLKKFNTVKTLMRDVPAIEFPAASSAWKHAVRGTRNIHQPLVRRLLDRRRQGEILLRPELRREILEALGAGNAELGRMLGRDLAPLGYMPEAESRR